MKLSQIRRHKNLISAECVSREEQHRAARALKAEWETFLAQSGFAFREDALSHETVSLEEAGFEEKENRSVFGLFAEGVSSGVRCLCDAFYEEDSAEFMVG